MKRSNKGKETYIPTTLRQRQKGLHEAEFVVAELTHNDGFNVLETMDTLIEALETVGTPRGRILRTELDDTYHVIWKWKQNRWERI